MSSVPCQTGGQGTCADATVVSAAFTAIAAGVPMPDVLTILSIYYNPCNLQQFWVGDGETTCGLSDLVLCEIAAEMALGSCTNCEFTVGALPAPSAAEAPASAAQAGPAPTPTQTPLEAARASFAAAARQPRKVLPARALQLPKA